jgi:DNA-binding PadR family transcriptional regulator
MTPANLPEFGRFAEPALLILVSLSDGPKHGYAIMTDVAAFAGITLGPGTLYTAISRLVEKKLITPASVDGRQRPYRLTPKGATVLTEQLTEMRRVAAIGLTRLRPA